MNVLGVFGGYGCVYLCFVSLFRVGWGGRVLGGLFVPCPAPQLRF